MALIRRKGATAIAAPAEPPAPSGPGKNRPTPSRKEAEAARRARLTRTVSKKEARREAARRGRVDRLKTLNAREATPEKTLMRDYIDARFSLGELLLPSLAVILLTSFLTPVWPQATLVTTIAMYAFILLVIGDTLLMWRGFKRVLAERLPKVNPKGLLLYGMNRCIQIRRFRMPPPRIKRGETY